MRPAIAPTWPYRPCQTGRAIPAVPNRPGTTTLSGRRDQSCRLASGCFFLEIERVFPLVRGSYVTNSVKFEDKDKNLKRRMCGEFVEKCRPSGPTYCNDAPLTNAGTPKRFASISYPPETRWPVCRTIGNPAPGLGNDSVVKRKTLAQNPCRDLKPPLPNRGRFPESDEDRCRPRC